MPADGFWGAMFGGQPATVLDYYNRDAQNLAATRLAQIKNALGQIQLNYAPQMAQQAADKGAADVTIEQNKAKYAPLLSQLEVQSKQLSNAINSKKFSEMDPMFQANLKIKQAQLDLIKNKIQTQGIPSISVGPADSQGGSASSGTPSAPGTSGSPSVSGAQGYQQVNLTPFQNVNPKMAMQVLDPNTGYQQLAPKNLYDPTASLLLAGKSQPNATAAPGSSFIPSVVNNPRVPNFLLPSGSPGQGGKPSSYFNPATGENFSAITPTQRTQIQNQVMAGTQAQQLLGAIKTYGTEGKFQAAGLSKIFPQWLGGTNYNDAAKYDMTKNMAVEHVMSVTKLRATNLTTHMMDTVLARQNGESREGYAQRIDAFNDKIKQLTNERAQTLKLGAMSLNDLNNSDGQAFLLNQYNKALSARSSGSLTSDKIGMVSPKGKIYDVSAKEAQEALQHGWKLEGQ